MDDELPEQGRIPSFLIDWVNQHGAPPEVVEDAPLRAAIYARRSTADPNFVSITRQISAGLDHCRRIGAFIDVERHIFLERQRTGRTMAGRTSLQALLEGARNKLFDIVVVQGLDRLTRSMADAVVIQAELERLGIAIHVAGRGSISTGEILLASYQHQKELDELVGRMHDGHARAALSGLKIAKRVPYGYDRAADGSGLVVNTEQALVIRRCFESIDGGMSRCRLITMLKNESIPGPSGGPWQITQLYKPDGYGRLQDPIYKGLWTRGRGGNAPVSVEVPTLAIIDAELFDRVNEKLRTAKARSWKAGVRPGLLTGIVRCSCGTRMIRAGRRINCFRRIHEEQCTVGSAISLSDAERQYYRVLLDQVLDPSRFADLQTVRATASEALERAAADEGLRLKMRLDEIASELDLFDDNVDDDPIASAIIGPLEVEFHELWERREQLVSQEFLRIDWAEATKLRSIISRMILRVPFIPTDPLEAAAVLRMHQLVPRMVIEKKGEDIVLRFLLGVLAKGTEKQLPPVASDRWIERPYRRSPRGAMQRPEAILAHHRDAEAGLFALSDREWAAIAHIFEPMGRVKGGHRLYAESMIFVARTGIPADMLPERYGRKRLHVISIQNTNIWPRLLAALDALGSFLVRDIDRDRFAPLHPS